MRIAFFGGSFDPPHNGHLAIANAAADRLALDRILFAPVGRQPLKRDIHSASFADRCRMIELAIAPNSGFELSLIDAADPTGRPNYTIETLDRLRATLTPADTLFCLMGADSFLTLHQWHRAADLILAANLIIATRPGFSLADLANALPAGLHAKPPIPATPHLATVTIHAPSDGTATLYLLPNLDYEISATQIRAALASKHLTATKLLPNSVLSYIQTYSLYSGDYPTPPQSR